MVFRILLLLLVAWTVEQAVAQPPRSSGMGSFSEVRMPDGEYGVSLRVWTEQKGGRLIWEEHRPRVPLHSGSIQIGLESPIPAVSEASELWLELTVDGYVHPTRVRLLGGGNDLDVDGVVVGKGLELLGAAEEDHTTILLVGNTTVLANSAAGPLGLSTFETPGVAVLRLVVEPSGLVRLLGGDDAELADGTGTLQIGSEANVNLVMDDNEIMARNNGATSTLFLQQEGAAVFVNGSLVHSSDARLKREVRDLDAGLDEVLALRPVSFAWKNADDTRHNGLIAQEVQAVAEELVFEGEKGHLGVVYSELVPVLIRALQEQNEALREQGARLERLEAQLAELNGS